MLLFLQTEIEGVKVFTLVRALARHRVVDVSMSSYHSAVVVEPGHVYTFGRNSEGQLGTGNTRPQNAPVEVKIFEKPAFVSFALDFVLFVQAPCACLFDFRGFATISTNLLQE